MRTMYDAVNAANIPAGAQMVAGYADTIKIPQWSAADWGRFPGATAVQIVKKASSNWGHVLDVEVGDATPAEAPVWARMRRKAGFTSPTIYCNASTWASVRNAFAAAVEPPPLYWVAQYDGVASIPGTWAMLGCVAKQYRGDIAPGYDLSVVADYWPGVDPFTPAPTPSEDDMPSFGTTAPAGTDAHVDLAVVGCTKLRLHCSWGQKIMVRGIIFHGDTNAPGVGGGYDGFEQTPPKTWQWDSDRPGPLAIPAGATTVTVRYDAAYPFFVSAASQ